MLIVAHPTLAGVNVFAEGAYTDDDLVVYIYANTTVEGTSTLRSAGVKLTYEPSQLEVTAAEKNDTVWSLGGEEYMNPETSTPGEVVIILGKLDPDNTSAGVSGERVLLGVVKFNRVPDGQFNPENPDLELTYGKRGTAIPESNPTEYSFKNFVDVDANVLDNANIIFDEVEIHKRGDANADGKISGTDRNTVRFYMINGGIAHPWMDCNADGETLLDIKISGTDRNCIKYKMTH